MNHKFSKKDLQGIGGQIYSIAPDININKFLNWVYKAYPETFRFMILIKNVHKDFNTTNAILKGLIEEFFKLQII